jgi:hypothetical protein
MPRKLSGKCYRFITPMGGLQSDPVGQNHGLRQQIHDFAMKSSIDHIGTLCEDTAVVL